MPGDVAQAAAGIQQIVQPRVAVPLIQRDAHSVDGEITAAQVVGNVAAVAGNVNEERGRAVRFVGWTCAGWSSFIGWSRAGWGNFIGWSGAGPSSAGQSDAGHIMRGDGNDGAAQQVGDGAGGRCGVAGDGQVNIVGRPAEDGVADAAADHPDGAGGGVGEKAGQTGNQCGGVNGVGVSVSGHQRWAGLLIIDRYIAGAALYGGH